MEWWWDSSAVFSVNSRYLVTQGEGRKKILSWLVRLTAVKTIYPLVQCWLREHLTLFCHSIIGLQRLWPSLLLERNLKFGSPFYSKWTGKGTQACTLPSGKLVLNALCVWNQVFGRPPSEKDKFRFCSVFCLLCLACSTFCYSSLSCDASSFFPVLQSFRTSNLCSVYFCYLSALSAGLVYSRQCYRRKHPYISYLTFWVGHSAAKLRINCFFALVLQLIIASHFACDIVLVQSELQ